MARKNTRGLSSELSKWEKKHALFSDLNKWKNIDVVS
jgi:hypothetical protein